MSIQELINRDKTFSESGFIAKVDNTFIMLLTAIMTENMARVQHKISDELFQRYSQYVNSLSKENIRQMYDELNVKSTHILDISEDENNYIINVLVISRYLDYKMDKTTFKPISGNTESRVEKNNYLTFIKAKTSKQEGTAKKCPGCGANVDVNNNGICEYCGTPYDTYNYDWVLTEIKESN